MGCGDCGDKSKHGLVQTFMEDLHPISKTILSVLLIIPLTLTISGLLLNINVGSIIERYIDLSLKKQEEQHRTLEDFSHKVLKRLDGIDTAINANTNNIMTITKDLIETKEWVCRHSYKVDRQHSPDYCIKGKVK